MLGWMTLLLLACVGGMLGHVSGIPVGALLGALLFVAAYQVMTRKLPVIPANAKRAIQMLLGANIGLSFTSETFSMMKNLWLAALLIPLLQLSIGILIGILLIKWLKMDVATAFCCAVPAGMSEIAFLAETHKASLPLVVTVHICRVFFLVFTIPFIIYLLL